MKPIQITAKSIADAWFQLVYNIFDNSYRQDIQQGSFENEQYRLQYPGVSIYIEQPFVDMVPYIPPALNLPNPTTEDFINDYFAGYIMNPELGENETYKYATRINETMPMPRPNYMQDKIPIAYESRTQLEVVIDMLRKTPHTNQAVIEIAKPDDIATCYGKDGKLDPPCLRLIDFKVFPAMPLEPCCEASSEQCAASNCRDKNVLSVSVYFRSWDLWAGLPTNLGGIELLKQYVANQTGLINGPMYAYSAGLHIYGYQEKFARIRTMKAANVGVEE